MVFILAPESGLLEQQSAPLALSVAILAAMALSGESKPADGKTENRTQAYKGMWMKHIVGISAAAVLLYGSITQTLIDKEAMREGTAAAENIARSAYETLIMNGQYDAGKTYAFIGFPCDNPLFCVTPIYEKSNSYAKNGGPWWGNELTQWTWNGIYRYKLGVNLPSCSDTEYTSLLQDENVKAMPVYPEEGSIQEISGIIVVKIS